MSQLRGPVQSSERDESSGRISALRHSLAYERSQPRATSRRTRTADVGTYRQHAKPDILRDHPGGIAAREGSHATHPRSLRRFPGSLETASQVALVTLRDRSLDLVKKMAKTWS